MTVLRVMIVWGLATVFVAAGVMKAWDPATFAQDISHYRLVEPAAAAALALYLPWLEILCGVAVLSPAWRRSGALILLIAILIFTAALVSAYARGLDLRCGCFGEHLAVSLVWALARNIVIAMTLLVLCLARSREGETLRRLYSQSNAKTSPTE